MMWLYLQIREVLLGYRLVVGLLVDMERRLVGMEFDCLMDMLEGKGMNYLVDKEIHLLVGKELHLLEGKELLLLEGKVLLRMVLHHLVGMGQSCQEVGKWEPHCQG